MALNFTFNTPAIVKSTGQATSIAYGRLQAVIYSDEETIDILLLLYISEADRAASRNDIRLDEIPTEIMSFRFVVTPLEWNTVDMAAWHDDILDILKEGSAAAKYPADYDQAWLGLEAIDALNTVTKTMPT